MRLHVHVQRLIHLINNVHWPLPCNLSNYSVFLVTVALMLAIQNTRWNRFFFLPSRLLKITNLPSKLVIFSPWGVSHPHTPVAPPMRPVNNVLLISLSCELTISRQLSKYKVVLYNRVIILICSYFQKVDRVGVLHLLKSQPGSCDPSAPIFYTTA